MAKKVPLMDLLAGGKKVLIVSPQPWKGFKVSKHHYAETLARLGNKVYFLGPPVKDLNRGDVVTSSTNVQGLMEVSYRPWLPHSFKFHFRALFKIEMKLIASRVSKLLNGVDVVWDFDNAFQFHDLRCFGAGFSIFHLVDVSSDVERHPKHADAVIALSGRLLNRIQTDQVLEVGHGLCDAYLRYATSMHNFPKPARETLAVGMIGNFHNPVVDSLTISKMISRFSHVNFKFFGPYENSDLHAEVGAAKNVFFKGLLQPEEIIRDVPKINIWLICYKPHQFSENSHKLLEYLSTGAPVVSSYLKVLENVNIVYCGDRASNESLLDLLELAIGEATSDDQSRYVARTEYAILNSYEQKVKDICKSFGE